MLKTRNKNEKRRETEGKNRTDVAEGKNKLRKGTQKDKELEEGSYKCR
jgi:hypothetical protein